MLHVDLPSYECAFKTPSRLVCPRLMCCQPIFELLYNILERNSCLMPDTEKKTQALLLYPHKNRLKMVENDLLKQEHMQSGRAAPGHAYNKSYKNSQSDARCNFFYLPL